MNYSAPYWLPGGNLQTIWPALYSRRFSGVAPLYTRERWTTPDGDFIDVDWLKAPSDSVKKLQTQPLLVLFHGLEGTSRSHYSEAFADFARTNNMAFAVPHFRGCSGEINNGPRAYHSGDFEEIGWILQRIRAQHVGPIVAIGISLGGNALLRWAQELGSTAAHVVDAVAAVSAPLDLAASGGAIGRGFNRAVYTRMFLNTMKPKAMLKLRQHPGLFNAQALLEAKDLYEFDNVFTAPLHGFQNTHDYWNRASSRNHLSQIRIPTLVVNARNDPFVPAHSLPNHTDASDYVTLWQPQHGGHVGFPQGRFPGNVSGMPRHIAQWLVAHTSAKK
jgi:predicted alpha/beta-fold hydrolase